MELYYVEQALSSCEEIDKLESRHDSMSASESNIERVIEELRGYLNDTKRISRKRILDDLKLIEEEVKDLYDDADTTDDALNTAIGSAADITVSLEEELKIATLIDVWGYEKVMEWKRRGTL